MNEQDATPRAVALHRELVLDDDSIPLREAFCRTAADVLMNVGSWLAVDSYLGGGDLSLGAHGPAGQDHERYTAFRATAAVVMMGSELVSGALLAFDAELGYAGAASVRQLLEVEYLLTGFDADFTLAAKWAGASPEDIRKEFTPASMRQIGGFSNAEYWEHCGFGGHPTPTGSRLLGPLFVPVANEQYFTKALAIPRQSTRRHGPGFGGTRRTAHWT